MASERPRDYWERFYVASISGEVPTDPSTFALWAESAIEPQSPIVEFGFGTGRDALWFASKGHPVLGFDFASSAVAAASAAAASQRLRAQFLTLDLDNEDACQTVDQRIASLSSSPTLYGRFLIHALSDRARLNFIAIASRALSSGGCLFLEFRTGLDTNTSHAFGEDHFRRYLDPEQVGSEIRDAGGTIPHLECGHGLAVYRDEDPHIARLIASWPNQRTRVP